MVPQSVLDYRREYGRMVPAYYSGTLHCLWTLGVAGGAALYHLSCVSAPSGPELLTLPATFLFGNWVEYVLHRWPLHKPMPPLRDLFVRHTVQHHHYFTDEAIEFQSTRDFKMVLFPEWAPLLIAGALTLFSRLVLERFISLNVASLFTAMGCAYFLMYEVFHFLHHTGENSLWAKTRFRRHHKDHHNLKLMTRYNFNVTFPIFDWVYGTTLKDPISTREKRLQAQSPVKA